MIEHERFSGLDPAVIDRLKRDFYDCLDVVQRREEVGFFAPQTRALAAEIFAAEPSSGDARDLRRYAGRFVAAEGARIGALIERLAAEIDLAASTRDVDVLLARLDTCAWRGAARREVLVNYLGFPFWDVLTFPVMPWREAGEFNEIRVDRISAQDASGITRFGAFPLKGAAFNQFAAFLSRAYRENDYLLGRLHAADRLIDIVCDAAGIESESDSIDVTALKKRAFALILDAEEKYLPQSADLVATLRRSISAIG